MPSAAGEDITLGEVARNLEALAKQVERGFERVDDRFNTLAMVHADVYVADRTADQERRKADVERVARLERSLSEKADLERLASIQQQVDAKADADVEGRIAHIEGSITWLVRALVGAVIIAAVGVVVAASGLPH